MDLKAFLGHPLTLKAWSRAAVPTGVRIALPSGYEGQVRPRSGLAARHGITTLNTPGTIDSDYRGEIRVLLFNASDEDYTIQPGDRIAQLVIASYQTVELEQVDEVPESNSERGEGGFGSTGR